MHFKQLYHLNNTVYEYNELFGCYFEYLTNKKIKEKSFLLEKANSYHYVCAFQEGNILTFNKTICYNHLFFNFANIDRYRLIISSKTDDYSNLIMRFVCSNKCIDAINYIKNKYNIEYEKQYKTINLAKPIIDYYKYFNYNILSCIFSKPVFLEG